MANSAMFFSDMDRTLIYSANALFLDLPDQQAPYLHVVEFYSGKPQSYMTDAAVGLLKTLLEAQLFVPVTTRTTAQYERIRLRGPLPHYAITTNGAQILMDGQPDQAWNQRMLAQVGRNCAALEEVRSFILSHADESWLRELRDADGTFLYALVNRQQLPDQLLAELSGWSREHGWRVSLQGRKLYFVPKHIGKDLAVAEVAQRLGTEQILAAGDSLLDQDFLSVAHKAFRPSHGELADTNFTAEHLQVIGQSGIMAGEAILKQVSGALLGTAAHC